MYKVSDFKKPVYRAGETAEILGVTTQTLHKYDTDGKLKAYRSEGGHRLFAKEDILMFLDQKGMLYDDTGQDRRDVIYVRIDPGQKKKDLDKQVIEILEHVEHLSDPLILKEIGSGNDENRKKLKELIQMITEKKIKTIYVLNRTSLAETGYSYLETLCKSNDTEIRETRKRGTI